MKQFKTDIEGAFAQPLSLNIYDSEFYSQVGVLKMYQCQVGSIKTLGNEETFSSIKYFFSTMAAWTLGGQALVSKCSERKTR